MKRTLVLFVLLYNSLCAQVNLNQGLVAYYPFTGNANDISGNNNNPVFNNASLTTDRLGNANSAYSFNGVDNYMQIPNSPSLNPATQISICAWVKVAGFYQGPCHGNNIVMKGDADFLPGNYMIRFDDSYITNDQNCFITSPDINHESFFGLQANQLPSTSFVQTNQWYSVVYTCDGITANTYVNCKLIGSGPANGITFNNNYDLFLGTMNNPQYPYWFNGVMDEVRIYNRAINQDEVKAYGECTDTDSIIINDYTPVLAFNPCENKITVKDASAFNLGDTVLMVQMKGAVIDSSNTSGFGTITNYKNAGNYEFNYVKSKSGNIIELKNGLTRQYDVPNGKVQLIRVPYYQDANFTSTLTCLPWDGEKGGVLVLNANNTVTLNANIDVSGRGFKGGIGYNPQNTTLDCFQNDYNYPLSSNGDAAMKGESVVVISNDIICGKGSPAGGGGGGLGHNSGGGGGANGGSGGLGGYQLDACGSSPFDNRGVGGHQLNYNSAINKIFLGSGGGAGQADNVGNLPNSGGNGGGIIIINSSKLTSNSYKILSNGDDGVPCSMPPSVDCHDGMGGGGAGGSILLNVNQLVDNSITENKGGKGADMIGSVALGHRIGAGGGGGGGMIFLKSSSLPANLTNINNGGVNGVLTTDGNNPWGATPGQNGTILFNLKIAVDSILFKPNIDSVRIKDSAIGCTGFNFTSLSYTNRDPVTGWQWDLGDGTTTSSQNTSHTYPSNGTYTVKLVVTDINGCRDSITKNVTTSNKPDFDFNYRIDECDPLIVQFAGIGIDTLNPWWAFGDATISTGNLNPLHSFPAPGNYVVRYAVTNGGCTDTLTKTINLVVVPDDLILTADTTICFGSAKELKTKPVLGFCWKPATYLNDPTSPNPITSTPQNITYYFTAQVPGQNIITNGDFTSGNLGFTSEYGYSNINTTEGEYYVGTNPSAWNGALVSCKDHTSSGGNMLLVNGSPTLNNYVWKQTVTVLPNTNYAFSTWIESLISTNPAQLQFSINGKDLGNLINARLPPCSWAQFYTTWNSGNNTTATISIVNKNIIREGNDFALDDISFSPVYAKQDSIVISIEKPVVKGFGDTTVCPGIQIPLNATGASTYSWSPSAGLNNSNIANPVATTNFTTEYIVTGTSTHGCAVKDTVNVIVYPKPAITKSNDASICKNSSIQLFAGGGDLYSWSPSASLSNSAISNPVASPAANTVYHVTVTDVNTCTNTDSIRIDIRPDPIFSVTDPTNLCVNGSLQLNAGGGELYSWQPSGSLNSSSIPDPTASPQITTNYSVVITDTVCNNTSTLTTTITVVSLPTVKASSSNDLDCNNDHSQLNATGATQYTWSPVSTLNNSRIANPVANPTTPTVYTVKGTDANGCVNYDSVKVDITDANKSGYFMASAFTPNNDGLNDCYGIKYWGVIQELDFGIYNRWGERIFHTTTPGACWDGTYKGVKQNPDVYVYLITAKTFCGKVFKKGTFALIR